jgi:hypothetical protein
LRLYLSPAPAFTFAGVLCYINIKWRFKFYDEICGKIIYLFDWRNYAYNFKFYVWKNGLLINIFVHHDGFGLPDWNDGRRN